MKRAFLQEAKSLRASLLCNKKQKKKGNSHINIKLLIKKRHGIKVPFTKSGHLKQIIIITVVQ